jgi:hypothetical protein
LGDVETKAEFPEWLEESPECRRSVPRGEAKPHWGNGQTGRVGVVDRVAGRVAVGLVGLVDERVDRQELPGLGVVVAVDEVGESGRVGVAAGVSEWRVAGKAAGGFWVAPGVVACVGGECACRAVDDPSD